ncbi:MAG: LiaF domain-containing protein [Actinomycetota bacterium]
MSGPSLPEPADSNQPIGPEPTMAERQKVIDRIQQAMAEDLIAFDELDDRFAAVYAAGSQAELERLSNELPVPQYPPPAPTARHPAPRSQFSLLGDIEVGGWVAVDSELTVTGVIGDITVDLSSADLGPDGVTINVRSLLGDTKVIVPDGARVQLDATRLIGDLRQDLSPPVEGGPLIRVTGLQAFGDLKVYSLSLVPDGALRRLWTKLRQIS